MANYGVNINFKVFDRPLDKALNKLKQVDKERNSFNKKNLEFNKAALKIIKQELTIKNNILKADRSILKVRQEQIKANQKNAATQPIPRTGGGAFGGGGFGGGGLGGPGLNSAIISGVFPLLFGQGPFAALGGATGGFLGGKFGGQMGGFAGGLAGTAIATGIQSGVTAIGELGQAMNRLNPDITKLTEKMGILGTTEQKRLEIIEKTEGKQAALNEALEMMGDKIGDQNVQELKKFGETFQDLTNSTVLFFTRVQAQVAKLLNLTIGDRDNRSVQRRTSQFLQQNPNAPAFRNINQQIADLETQKSGAGKQGIKDIEDQINGLEREKREIAETIVLEKDKDQIRANTNKLITAGLGKLEEENQLSRAIIAGKEEEFLIEQAVNAEVEKLNLTKEKINQTQLQRIKDGVIINRDLKEQAELAKKVNESFKKLKDTIAVDIGNGIKGLIKGTQSLNDVLTSVLDRMADAFLNMAIFGNFAGTFTKGEGLLGAIFKANGGPVTGGKPYIVGEKGPELFTPGVSGNITPNHKLGGSTNVVVNVDASGSSVQGDDQSATALGELIGAAVQAEIVNQKMDGGLLS